MYAVIEFEKESKHKVGAANKPLKSMGQFKLLVDAEKRLYNVALDMKPGGNIGIVLKDLRYNTKRVFWNPTNGLIYVKTLEKNDVGKLSYNSYTLPQYKRLIVAHARNPFSKVI